MARKKQKKFVIIYITTGFAEDAVLYCLGQMREHGIKVWLVSLIRGLVRSQHGVPILADKQLTEMPATLCPQLVILPGDQHCLSLLSASPNVQQTIENTVAHGGNVALLGLRQEVSAETLFVNQVAVAQVQQQHLQDISTFVSRLIHLIMA